MLPRTLTFAICVFLLHAIGGEVGERTVASAERPATIHAGYQQPLPFLGSAGLVVSSPVLEPTSPLPALRSRRNSASGALAVPRLERRGTARLGLRSHYLEAGRTAFLLGTPPPQPRSGLA